MRCGAYRSAETVGGDDRIRTGDRGFADRCLATWLRRREETVRILPNADRGGAWRGVVRVCIVRLRV